MTDERIAEIVKGNKIADLIYTAIFNTARQVPDGWGILTPEEKDRIEGVGRAEADKVQYEISARLEAMFKTFIASDRQYFTAVEKGIAIKDGGVAITLTALRNNVPDEVYTHRGEFMVIITDGEATLQELNAQGDMFPRGESPAAQLADELRADPAPVSPIVAQFRASQAQAAAERKADDLRQRQEDLTQASKDAAKAIDEQRQKLSDLNDLALSINGSDLALERANAGLGESMDTLAEKQKAVTDAVNAYGEDSPEAAAAARDYDKALIDSKGSADNLAKAEVERARKQAEIAGQTLTDAQAVDIYSGSIGRTRDVTNDPNLAAGLDGMAKRTGAVADAAAVAKQKLDEANQAAANLAAQAFGERAADIAKAIINKAPGFNQQRAEPATAGTSVTNNVTVNASTPANPWSIAQDVDWALRTAGR